MSHTSILISACRSTNQSITEKSLNFLHHFLLHIVSGLSCVVVHVLPQSHANVMRTTQSPTLSSTSVHRIPGHGRRRQSRRLGPMAALHLAVATSLLFANLLIPCRLHCAAASQLMSDPLIRGRQPMCSTMPMFAYSEHDAAVCDPASSQDEAVERCSATFLKSSMSFRYALKTRACLIYLSFSPTLEDLLHYTRCCMPSLHPNFN